MPELTAAKFQALGVYDPGAPNAALRLELLEYLVGLGATPEDLVAYRDELPGLASVVAIRGGGQALTMSEAVERAGVSEQKLLQINRAAGFPQPTAGERILGEQFADLLAGLAASEGDVWRGRRPPACARDGRGAGPARRRDRLGVS